MTVNNMESCSRREYMSAFISVGHPV